MNKNRKTLLSVPVDICRPDEFISMIESALNTSGIKTLFAINPEKIMRAQKDLELLLALQESDFAIADGIGTVLGLRLFYGGEVLEVSRTTGIMLTLKLIKLAAQKKLGVFVFGARPLSNARAVENILKQYPSLNIVGTQHGYIPEKEYDDLVEKINSSGADILFVALGSPKQEKWIFRYKKSLNIKFCMGIGGSLDVISGIVPGAPFWAQKLGVEWLYRLLMEPSRFKRQLVLPTFVFSILKKKFLPGD